MSDKLYNKLRKALYEENGYQEDFVNCFFNRMCQKVCGVQCNEHYIEGPEHANMAGCFVMQFDVKQADDFLNEIFSKVDDGYLWNDGWVKT